MKKEADNTYPVHSLIKKRWSPRAFSSQNIERQKINSLFEAARWAASSRNLQPWRFIYATSDKKEMFQRLFDCLVEFNQNWVKTAPLLILTVAKTIINGRQQTHALHDVGLAIGNLSLQATAMDLYVHQMGGFDVEKARKEFNLPDGYEPVTMIAAGYIGESNILPDDLQKMEMASRERMTQESFVFEGDFKR